MYAHHGIYAGKNKAKFVNEMSPLILMVIHFIDTGTSKLKLSEFSTKPKEPHDRGKIEKRTPWIVFERRKTSISLLKFKRAGTCSSKIAL